MNYFLCVQNLEQINDLDCQLNCLKLGKISWESRSDFSKRSFASSFYMFSQCDWLKLICNSINQGLLLYVAKVKDILKVLWLVLEYFEQKSLSPQIFKKVKVFKFPIINQEYINVGLDFLESVKVNNLHFGFKSIRIVEIKYFELRKYMRVFYWRVLVNRIDFILSQEKFIWL